MAYLNKLAEDRVSLAIPVDPKNDPDNKVNIVYRPNAYDGKVEAVLQGIDPEREAHRSFGEAVCALVESWDLKWDETDDKPLALDPDELVDVPLSVLVGILDRIKKDAQARSPKHRTSKRSNTH